MVQLLMKNKNNLVLIVLVLFVQCAAPVKDLYPSGDIISETRKIYIIKYEWHTGIAFNRKEANPYLPILNDEFTNTEFLEVGWGDLAYFTAVKGNIILAIRAVLWPTKSALNVMGFNKHPVLVFGEKRVIEITVSNQGFINIIRHINNSFATDSNMLNIKLNTGNYGLSQYYLSKEKYHGFKTCNVWTARAIRKTGYPISPFYALRANNIFYQVKRNRNKKR